ncbi:hypothetical protein NLJ89_g816 [Agrocybe chaxingu]|uniref:alpha-1,2-Mannosidase n=1 Tax=Agrocybe chaxingu TaxID=84603 RepID=A0A9W8N177_9AGAR|nr:hypothetical protein NLJ89_g816 [Agrocybe chaxingu]
MVVRQLCWNRFTRRTLFYGVVVLLILASFRSKISPFFVPSDKSNSRLKAEDSSPLTRQTRAEAVKAAFLHAYHGYEDLNGWGLTAFDSLDTMLLMGLKEEFARAQEIVTNADFSKSEPEPIPYFETVIRYLGGLLSAYALSKDKLFIERAEDLVEVLEPAFSTKSGFPLYSVDVVKKQGIGSDVGTLSEMATLQLEYAYLAKVTVNVKYYNRAAKVMDLLAQAKLEQTGGMLPTRWDLTTGQPVDRSLADSAHEYLLKFHLLTGKTDKESLKMYLRTTTRIISDMLYLSPTRHLLYVSDSFGSTFTESAPPTLQFEHLSCFLPGLLALGAHSLPLDNLNSLGIDLEELGNEKLYGYAGRGYKRLTGYNLKQLHMWAAEGLAQTCWLMYADQPTGLGPEEVKIKFASTDGPWRDGPETHLWVDAVDKWKRSGSRGVVPGLAEKTPVVYTPEERNNGTGSGHDYTLLKPGHLLRPETVESLYLLWRITGDFKWRDRGWNIFEAIERETKTDSGYATLYSVETGGKEERMPSYFLAETLKYLYLMFMEDDPITPDQWSFNTEAHPLPVFEWTQEEIKLLNVTLG